MSLVTAFVSTVLPGRQSGRVGAGPNALWRFDEIEREPRHSGDAEGMRESEFRARTTIVSDDDFLTMSMVTNHHNLLPNIVGEAP